MQHIPFLFHVCVSLFCPRTKAIWGMIFRSICKWNLFWKMLLTCVVKRRIRSVSPWKGQATIPSLCVCLCMYLCVEDSCRHSTRVRNLSCTERLLSCELIFWRSGRRKHNYEIMGLSAVLLSMYKVLRAWRGLRIFPCEESNQLLCWFGSENQQLIAGLDDEDYFRHQIMTLLDF